MNDRNYFEKEYFFLQGILVDKICGIFVSFIEFAKEKTWTYNKVDGSLTKEYHTMYICTK